MAHLPRLLAEQAANILTIAASFTDRLLLMGVMYRIWGPALFEQWASWIAIAALIGLFDLGYGLYFANRIAIEKERGDPAASVRIYKVSNFISVATALLALVFAAFAALGTEGATGSFGHNALILFLLGAAPALRIAMGGPMALYRANRQYARQLTIFALGEIARVAVSLVLVLAGGSPLVVAAAALLVTVATQAFYMIDATRRFEPRRFVAAAPTLDEFKTASVVSFGFLMQVIPIQLLTNASVIVLTQAAPGLGVVAAFVLARTLVNFPRALLQQFGSILGIECARRIVSGDMAGARMVWARTARGLAALSGLVGGLLLASGPALFKFWTGSADAYNPAYLAAFFAPMILGCGSVLNHSVLVAANVTRLPALGRMVQLFLSIALFWSLPIADAGLRMAVALSAGEIIGFMPLSIVAIRGLAPTIDARLELQTLAMSCLSMLAAMAVMWLTTAVIGEGSVARFLVAFFISGLICALMLPWLGVDKEARKAILKTLAQFMNSRRGA